jgi:hypothetical protein
LLLAAAFAAFVLALFVRDVVVFVLRFPAALVFFAARFTVPFLAAVYGLGRPSCA